MNELALTYFHEAYRHQMAGNLARMTGDAINAMIRA